MFNDRIKQVGNNFKILHYASKNKPWSRPELPFAEKFWSYAATSVFFSEIISKEFDKLKNNIHELNERVVSAENKSRGIKEGIVSY